jgi:DNA-binding winged helix-turn-helix (wHTH) protein
MEVLEKTTQDKKLNSILTISNEAQDCEIDLRTGLIVKNKSGELERVSRLGRKDIAVLSTLLASNGELVTRDELLDTIWQGRIVTDNVLTVAISNIRKALKMLQPTGDQFIITVNGIGYLIDVAKSGIVVYCERN